MLHVIRFLDFQGCTIQRTGSDRGDGLALSARST
jgi:hypothetical protein